MKQSHHWRDNCPGRITSSSSTRASGPKSASSTCARRSASSGAKRELERQFKTALFERTVLHPVKVTPVVLQTHPDALSVFQDSYLVEFLDLQPGHLEAACTKACCCKPSCTSCMHSMRRLIRQMATTGFEPIIATF